MNKEFINALWTSIKKSGNPLKVKIGTIRKWIKAEKIPCHKVGKLWKFKISEVGAWIMIGQAKDEEID